MNDLDKMFAQALAEPVPVSDDLMARVMADAQAAQPGAVARGAVSQPRNWVCDLLGGWPALGGVLAAGVTGLWVGVAPPASVEGFVATLIGTTQAVTFLPEADLSYLEEPIDG